MASIRIDTAEELGNSTLVAGSFVGPASYATGGETLTIADTAQHDITIERIVHASGGGGGYVLEWDKATQKAKVMRADYPAASAGPLVETAAAVNLSAVTFNVVAIGQ